VSTVHVGSTVEYAMLEATEGLGSSCVAASSERSASMHCGLAVDHLPYTGWVTDREQVGGWIAIAFDDGR
jgi:hypothetical protein